MRLSQLFGRTLRETPAEAELISHQYLLRAGMIRQLAAGIFTYLPLGWRVLKKIEKIMREEMDAIGCQDMSMPVVNPAEVWQATGRWQAPAPGPTLLRFKDRTEHDMVLAMTHEEVVTHLLRSEISSYRQLPVLIYHIQTKFRDEPRSRGGLIRVREFTMKDAYSAHADYEGLDEFYPKIYHAYERIFARCGVKTFAVEADPGIMGGSVSHEFMALSSIGENVLISCTQCGYAASAEKAEFIIAPLPAEEELPKEEVATPGCKTIEAVANFVGVPTNKTYKAVFYTTSEGELVFVVIRGDLEVNETKLSNVLEGVELRPATEEELAKAGIVAGYASPIGVKGVKVIADKSIASGRNFVAGANKEGYHLKNVNYPRDFPVTQLADIALARGGDTCPRCRAALRAERGIEAGHLFKLGTKYSAAVGATYLDKDGKSKPIVMGSYGIGTGRLMSIIVEQHHDEKGIIWPLSVAPYQIHLLHLGADQQVKDAAERLYTDLQQKGYEVLYDDREETAGVKFNDADLIGVPLRLTVSTRTCKADAVEAKRRWEKTVQTVPLAKLFKELPALLHANSAILLNWR